MKLDVEDKWRYTKLGEFPPVEQEVLIFVDGWFRLGYIENGEWYVDDWVYYSLDEDIAWRPLPEEPKGV